MTKHRIPSFLTRLGKEEKEMVMKEWLTVQQSHSMSHLRKSLQSELDRLIKEDEKSSFSTWFQTKWSRSKNLGKREILRKLINDLTRSTGDTNEL